MASKKTSKAKKAKIVILATIAIFGLIAFRILAFPSTTVFPGVTFFWDITDKSEVPSEEKGTFSLTCSSSCDGETKLLHTKEVPIISKVEQFKLCFGKLTNNCPDK